MNAAIVNRQSAIRNPDDWITVDEAAALTGMTVRHWRRLALRALGRSLAVKGSPPGGRGKPVWWVHRCLDSRLSRCPGKSVREDHARVSLMANYPAHHVDLAYRKAAWLSAWRARCERPRPAGQTDIALAGEIVTEAKAVEGDDFRISPRSLQAWHQAYNSLGPDGKIRGVEALVPRYSATAPVSPGDQVAGRSPEAVEFFYALYHSPNRMSARMCHDATVREAQRHGWQWAVSCNSTTHWLQVHDRRDLSCLHREGTGAYSHKYMEHIETDWSAIQPGDMYVCDHTQCDFWVTHRGNQIRPWLTAIQDMRSRAIVGLHLGPSPHSDAIAIAMRTAFADWAIPTDMRIDNGKDFCSRWITGLTKKEVRRLRSEFGGRWKDILRQRRDQGIEPDPRWLGLAPELGINLIYAIPYAAWSKGTVERFFGRFEDQCGKTFVTYCGNSPQTKPESLKAILQGKGRTRARTRTVDLQVADSADIPTLEAARERIDSYVDDYHRSAHRGDGMNGRTPLQVWATATSLRKADPVALAFLVSIRGTYKVGGNGVSLTVSGARLSFGATCQALRRYAGREVLVGADPARPIEAFAFDTRTRRLIARLEPNKRIHPSATSDDVREAIAEGQRGRKVMRKAKSSGPRRARTASQLINNHVAERHTELMATGTEDAQPTIAPVRTGFEGVSTPVRPPAYNPPDDGAIEDLFIPDDVDLDDDSDSSDIEDLFEPDVPREPDDTDLDDGPDDVFNDAPVCHDTEGGLECLL